MDALERDYSTVLLAAHEPRLRRDGDTRFDDPPWHECEGGCGGA